MRYGDSCANGCSCGCACGSPVAPPTDIVARGVLPLHLLRLIQKINHKKSRSYGKVLAQRIWNNIQNNRIDRPKYKSSTDIMRNHNQVVLGYISTACHIIDLE
jgi:hypothetical protein